MTLSGTIERRTLGYANPPLYVAAPAAGLSSTLHPKKRDRRPARTRHNQREARVENSGAGLVTLSHTTRSRSPTSSFACGGFWAGVSCLATYVHGKEGVWLKADTENCLVEKENQDISCFDQYSVQIMFCGIHFLHEMLLYLLEINRKKCFTSRFLLVNVQTARRYRIYSEAVDYTGWGQSPRLV